MAKMIKIALVNVQSIKRKEIILLDELMARNIDICAVTETWLKDTMYDRAWVDTSGFKMNFWDSKWVNRVGKRGDGIGIIWNKSEMKCKEISHGAWPTFEFGIWKFFVRNHNKTLATVTIYRPPGKEPISKFCVMNFWNFFPVLIWIMTVWCIWVILIFMSTILMIPIWNNS